MSRAAVFLEKELTGMWFMVSGIRSTRDAIDALNMGADAFGLVVEQTQAHKSSCLSPQKAAFIMKNVRSELQPPPKMSAEQQDLYQASTIESLSRFGQSVLVTHITDVYEIISIAKDMQVTTIQLVGHIEPEDIAIIKKKLPTIHIIKSLPVCDDSCLASVKKYIAVSDAIELDTFDSVNKRIGGTGRTHDWNISKIVVEEYGWKIPIILAGGLNRNNIENALRTVGPAGIDVSSCIRDSEGMQDNAQLRALVQETKLCDETMRQQVN